MKNLFLFLILALGFATSCATDTVDSMDAATATQELLAPTPVPPGHPPPIYLRSSALAPVLGVPPGSGDAFDPLVCTEYGCDSEGNYCSYFPSGCGGDGGGGGGGCSIGDDGIGAQWGCGGGGGVQCQTSQAQTGQYCRWATCLDSVSSGYTGILRKQYTQTTTCSDGSTDYVYWSEDVEDPATCPITQGCWWYD